MTREETRAASFVGGLLLLAAVARFAARPRPITINAGPVDIAALRAAGQALQQAQPTRPAKKARGQPQRPRTGTTASEADQPEPPAHKRRAPLVLYDDEATTREAAGPLDLNRASTIELEKLPGVGPSMAKRIVARRDSVGRFSKLEDLDAVRGIGPALLKKLAPLVVVR